MSLRRFNETLPCSGPLLIWALTDLGHLPVNSKSLDCVDQFARGAEAESVLRLQLRFIPRPNLFLFCIFDMAVKASFAGNRFVVCPFARIG